MQYIQYLIIAIVLFLIALVVLKASKKDFYIEANKLVECLGGKDNIINIEVNMSRFKVTLKDVTLLIRMQFRNLEPREL